VSEREELLDRVDAIGPVLEAHAVEGDRLGRLADATVEALRGAGLLTLKVPRELGGFEAEPALQYEVFERVAHYDIAAAWCLFIYADTAGMLGARLPDGGLAEVFAGGAVPVCAGGGGLRPGTMAPADDGVLLSGRWRYGSGIAAAAWVMVSGYLPGTDGGRGQVLTCAVPRAVLDVDDDWVVHGLRATGSNDFGCADVFVPAERLFAPAGPTRRGGRQYRTGVAGYLSYTVPAVCGAVARRALEQVMATAGEPGRSYAKAVPPATRASFQRFCGEADQRLRAARALMLADGDELMAAVDRPGSDLRALDARTRAAAAHATQVAADVLHELGRYAGGASMRQDTYLERARRDVAMAAGHLLVDDIAFENHGQFLLGVPGADPMR
jgi:alkylation response protein AidB-like acyl-CoA dehydrogenase